MLCVSFDRSHRFGVAFAIDLIKGIMHCLMSFTLGWVEKNCSTFFDPKFTHSLSFLILCPSHPPFPAKKSQHWHTAQTSHKSLEPFIWKRICFSPLKLILEISSALISIFIRV